MSSGWALLAIDVQHAFVEAEKAGKRRNNPDALERIVELLTCFRNVRAPIFHVRHSGLPASPFAPDKPGFAAIDEACERPGEAVVIKRRNSAFIGTDLEQRLHGAGIRTLVICGATTNHCVETSTRMAGNLDFDTQLAADATWTFDLTTAAGKLIRAEDVQEMTEANLSGEFATIVRASDVVRTLR